MRQSSAPAPAAKAKEPKAVAVLSRPPKEGKAARAGSPAGSGGETAALKAKLKAKLSTLLSDDAFLDALVAEYLAQAATLKPKAAATAPAPAPAPAAAASPDVPPHLLALLQQQVGP